MKIPSAPAPPAAPQVREQRNAIATVAILRAMLLVVTLLTLNGWRIARTHERAACAALRGYACKCRTVLAPNYVFRVNLEHDGFQSAGDSAVLPDVQRHSSCALCD